MEGFFAPFSNTTANQSTTTTTTSTTSSSSNINLPPQNMGHPQNVNVTDNNGQLGHPEPYFVPYNQNMSFQQHVHSFSQVNQYPMYSFPVGQSNIPFRMPNFELQGWSQQGEEGRNKMMEAHTSKAARDRRKQARQRSRSSAPMAPQVPERTIRQQPITGGGSNVRMTIKQDIYTNVFYTPDGKRLEEILTKKLKKSDVGVLGRIVLPKREAEYKLPVLADKEGIDVVFKDVYSELRWTLKYRYWINNKSRMYVLENTGDFVNHYELQMEDSITLYEDEIKNLYVLIKKEQNVEVSEPSSMESLHTQNTFNFSPMDAPYVHQDKDKEEESYLALLELNHEKKAEAANNLLIQCAGGSSSSGTKDENIAQHQSLNNAPEGAPSQATEEAAAPPVPRGDRNILINDDNFDEVYGNLDNIFEIENNGFDDFDLHQHV
ncbi:B3 domain-containing transcription factor LEC2, partial [Mucuna pruriens]